MGLGSCVGAANHFPVVMDPFSTQVMCWAHVGWICAIFFIY